MKPFYNSQLWKGWLKSLSNPKNPQYLVDTVYPWGGSLWHWDLLWTADESFPPLLHNAHRTSCAPLCICIFVFLCVLSYYCIIVCLYILSLYFCTNIFLLLHKRRPHMMCSTLQKRHQETCKRRKPKKTDFQKIISFNPTVDDVSRVTQVSGSSIDDLAVWLSWDSPSCVKPFLVHSLSLSLSLGTPLLV